MDGSSCILKTSKAQARLAHIKVLLEAFGSTNIKVVEELQSLKAAAEQIFILASGAPMFSSLLSSRQKARTCAILHPFLVSDVIARRDSRCAQSKQ